MADPNRDSSARDTIAVFACSKIHQENFFVSPPVKLGIVGLGRWAKVLTRAVQKSDKLEIVAAYSRSEEKRAAFEESRKQQDAFSKSEFPEGAQLCKKCNTAAVIMMDGCMTCLACGDSKCG